MYTHFYFKSFVSVFSKKSVTLYSWIALSLSLSLCAIAIAIILPFDDRACDLCLSYTLFGWRCRSQKHRSFSELWRHYSSTTSSLCLSCFLSPGLVSHRSISDVVERSLSHIHATSAYCLGAYHRHLVYRAAPNVFVGYLIEARHAAHLTKHLHLSCLLSMNTALRQRPDFTPISEHRSNYTLVNLSL